jgi:hypothetical protein
MYLLFTGTFPYGGRNMNDIKKIIENNEIRFEGN